MVYSLWSSLWSTCSFRVVVVVVVFRPVVMSAPSYSMVKRSILGMVLCFNLETAEPFKSALPACG